MSRQILLFLSIFVFAVLLTESQAFRQQSVGIRGRLMCGDKPLDGTKIKLWNKNKLGRDDQLADVTTDANGNFQMDGGVGSVFKMDVRFKIYHNCDRKVLPCQRKVNLGIPSDYISRSSTVTKYFEAGVMNMQFVFPDEETSCIN